MPDIPLLQPQVLRGVVEKFTAPETMILSNRLPKTPWPYPSAVWDVVRGSRLVAKPNVPNSEAHIVPKLGVSQESASFVYLREKKVFEPTTMFWLRTPGEIAGRNAEAAVLREMRDLNQRFDNFIEWCGWQMLKGTLTLDYPDVQAVVDYKLPSSHKPATGVGWSTATPQNIRDDVTAWKRLISRDGQVKAGEVFLTEPTLNKVVTSFTNYANGGVYLLSDRMKDQFYETGQLPGFLGLNWNVVEHTYEADDGTITLFLPDNALILANMTDNRPVELYEGPTADDEAPDYFTGKFTKTWKEKDPSARQVLLEWHALPVMTRPEQFVYVANVG